MLESPTRNLLRTDVHVFSDSVLSVGGRNAIANEAWAIKIKYSEKNLVEELKNSALECSGLWPTWDAESLNISALFEQPIGHLVRTKVHVCSDSVWCVGYNTFPNQTVATNFVEVWDPTTFMDNYDITGRPVQFHRHILSPDSHPNHERDSNILGDIRNPLIEKEESYSCRCSTTLHIGQKTTSKHVSQTQQRLPNTHTNSIKVIGVSVDLDASMLSHVLEQTKRSRGSHRLENDTEA